MTILRNEQDVREEIATPLLKALGYESGTANDIRREHRLRYAAMQLGRKKLNDAPLPQGGDVDYLLTIAGVARWVLETKPPDVDISVDDVDQATSYARHPEVSAHYAAILNGSRFVLYHSSQTSNDPPLLDQKVTSVAELFEVLNGLLSPEAIRRDCPRPKIDLRAPLAPGYRGEVPIIGGWNKQVSIELETRLPIPPAIEAELRAGHTKLVGMQSTVKGGRIWRDEASRIRVRLSWHPPHADMQSMLQAARLDDFEYVCLDETISTNEKASSVFDILASFQLQQGQVIYDLLKWKAQTLGFDATFTMQGQATGYLRDNELRGTTSFRTIASVPGIPEAFTIHFLTEFAFVIDGR